MKKVCGDDLYAFLEHVLPEYANMREDSVLIERGEIRKGHGELLLSFDSGKEYKISLDVLPK